MIPRLTYTATRTYLECPHRFQLVYLEQRAYLVAPSLFLGSTLHLALSTYYQQRIDKAPMTCQECEAFFSEAFRKQTVLPSMPYARGVSWGSQDPGLLEADTRSLLGLYLKWAEKTGFSPVCVERDMSRTVGDLPISGRIDAIDRSGIVIDWKTSRVRRNQSEEDRPRLQPIFYAALLGHPIEFHYHYLHKLPAHEISWEARTITRGTIQWLTHEFLPPIWRAMHCGAYPYADPSSWFCAPTRCDYWETCKGGALRSF